MPTATPNTETALQQLSPRAATPGPGITYLLDYASGRILDFSPLEGRFPPAFYRLLEATQSWSELVLEAFQAPYREATAAETFQKELHYRIRINRRGETLTVADYRELLRDESGQPQAIAGRLVDDSFRDVVFDALSRRSWKEIAGAMTRRYLHDFNNTIAGIYSLSELYAEPGSDPASTAKAMGHIRDCSIRAQDLTKKIRHLTTLEAGPEALFNLGSLVAEQQEYMAALLPKGAPIAIDVDPGEHPIRIDPNEFRQVILHLAGNASDAAGDEAEISIRVRRADENGRPLARIDFADNGPGFKPDELERATEPFYSTKGSEKHPGLGLSIVDKFTRRLGGRLELENGETGALVRLWLPLVDLEGPPADAETNSSEAPSSQSKATAAPPAARPLSLLVYSWEDISRHPLLIAMQQAQWQIQTYCEPGPLLLDLMDETAGIDGVLAFKSALDEKAEPLIFELDRARNCEKIALVTLGESPDALPSPIKSICGFIATGSSKPTALLKKLSAYFR